jgi:hypothetical protein
MAACRALIMHRNGPGASKGGLPMTTSPVLCQVPHAPS